MHEAILAEAAIASPTNIRGLWLKPYSIGHELWLIRQESPFVCGGEVSKAHLHEAVLMCSEGWDGAAAMNRDWLIPLKLKLWKWRTRNEILALGVEQFRSHRERGSLCFKINPSKSGQKSTRSPGAPFLLRLQMFLMEHLRLSESQAWDYPLGLASMKWCAYWESRDGIEIYNEHDQNLDNFQQSNDARLKVFIDSGMSDEDAWAHLIKEGLSCQA